MLELYLGYKDRKTSILGSMETEQNVGSILNGISVVCLLAMVFNHTMMHRLKQFLYNRRSGIKPKT